jgi:U3 small nucleolar RNA-associated protein 4
VVSEVQLTTVKVGGNTRSGKQNEVGKWIHTHSRRLHAHDVRAITISPSYSSLFPSKFQYSHNIETNRVPIVISGGYDFSLVYTPAATTSTAPNLPNPVSESQGITFTTSNQKKASYIPQRVSSLVSLAHDAGIMAERTLQGINLWALRAVTGVQKAPPKGQEYQKLSEMQLNTQTNLISSAISDDGKWLAASDSYEVRLWHLKANVSHDSVQI